MNATNTIHKNQFSPSNPIQSQPIHTHTRMKYNHARTQASKGNIKDRDYNVYNK